MHHSKLARHQLRLNPLLPLVLMTDDRQADWMGAARRLPKGAIIIVRARAKDKRVRIAQALKGLAPLLIADDPMLASHIGAHGLHLPQARMREALYWRAVRPNWIITASAHSLGAVLGARHLDALFLAPVFKTPSHPLARPLGAVRANFIAAASQVPIYALGGVNADNAALLGPSFSGIAAISALL